MTFDRLVEILKQNEELKDWHVDQPHFKGDKLVSAKVVFEFDLEDDTEND